MALTISTTRNAAVALLGTDSPVTVTQSGAVIEAGASAALGGPAILTPWTISNQGVLQSAQGEGVLLFSGGTITNGGTANATASITGGLQGIEVGGDSSVVNFGSITGLVQFGVWFGTSGTLANGDDTHVLARISGGSLGVLVAGGAGSITNGGTIQGAGGAAVSLFAGGSVANGSTANAAATLTGGVDGIHAYTVAADVANAGTIIGSAGSGVELEAGGTLANTGTASLLSGGSFGGLLLGAGQVHNQGTMLAAAAGGLAAWIGADGTITNGGTANAVARMQGGTFGAIISGAGAVANYGALIGDATFGVWIADVGTLGNSGATALISGGNVGAIISGPSGTIDNGGSIFGGTLFGAWMAGQGVVHNGLGSTTATIEGVGNGLVIGTGAGTVDNAGTIKGDSSFGLWLSSGGTLANGGTANAAALVSGGAVGLLVTGGLAQISNFATISSPGLIGAAVQAGGTLTNGSPTATAALVSGGSFGALLAGAGTELFNYGSVRGAYAVYAGDTGAPETVHNAGTLASALGANGYAVFFATAGNTLDVQPGAVFTGRVELGGGTLKASGGAVALTGLGAQFHGLATLAVDPAAVLNLSGANTLVAGATLAAGAHIALAPAATFDLEGSLAGGGATDVFALGASARLVIGANAAGTSFAPEIDNFAAGNRVDIAGLTPNGTLTAAIGPANSVVLSDQSGTLYTLGNVHFAAGAAPGLVAGVDAGHVFLTATAPGADVVIQWSTIARAAITSDATAPVAGSRAMAIESLAVYDTMQAIQGLPGYSVSMAPAPGVNADAALVSAAATVMKALYPAQGATFDALLAANLAAIADGGAKTDGIALGQAVAAQELALRAHDGSDAVEVFIGNNAPGEWRPTGPSFTPASLPQFAHVEPFALDSPEQFSPPSIPALDSPDYAASVNQVQSLGDRDSTTRTAEQTQIAKFWNDQTGTDTPPGQWNQIAATVATAKGLSLAEDARLFAMLNVALADAGIADWSSKFAYNGWRPITVIQEGGTGNPALTPDPTWQPLLTTPNFPEYVSGHSTFSGAAATVLGSVFGDATGFSATSQSAPGVTRSYTSFSQAAQEAAVSRIYAGIHFDFSITAGLDVGTDVANWTIARFGDGITPIPRILINGASGQSVATNPVITGQVNAAAGTTLAVSFDGGGTYVPVTLDATGHFSVQTPFATDGTADGAHGIYFRATDPIAQTAEASFGFVLASQGPDITLDPASLQDNATLSAASVLAGTVTPALNGSLRSLTYTLDGGTPMPIAFDPATYAFATSINLFAAAAGAHTIVLTATDAAGNATPLTLHETMAAPAPFTVASLTPTAYETDIGVTYRPMVTFSRAVDPTTLTTDSFFITDSAGNRVAANVAPLAGGRGAWLLPIGALPGGSTLTLHLDAALIKAADGTPLDITGAQADGTELLDPFTTVATAIVPGTTITGLVVDPGPDNTPLTPDDVSNPTGSSANFPLNTWKLPLAGVKVFILGHEAEAVLTDATGHFTLTNVPSGDVKLAMDGRTATNPPAGFFFPEMVFDLDIRPGVENGVGSALGAPDVRIAEQDNPSVYLPRIPTDIMQPLSATTPTTIHAPADAAGASGMNLTAEQLSQLSITVMPGSLLDAAGNPVQNPSVGISPVPSALVKDMLPPGLEQHTFDITIQTPGGAVLTQPAQLSFPNVFGLAPGEKTYMISFNHTTGLLEVDGTGTASADGKTVTTDPGSGVVQPGWHGYTDPKSRAKTKVVVKNPNTGLKEVVYLDAQEAQAALADTASFWASRSGDLNNVVNGSELAARQFEHQFAKTVATQAGRFAPIGLGIDGVVLANDTGTLYKDLNTANTSGSLVDGLAVVEDGIKVSLDTAITGLDYATIGGVATAETGVGAIEAVAAQGLKDVLNIAGIGLSVADYGLQFGGDYVARHFDNAGNSNADILGPKFDPDLVLHVAEDAWNGNAMITVSIDGVQVLGPTAITALHGANSQDITISGILGEQAHTVLVTLVNGASGEGLDEQRNAYILGANFNGQEFAFSTPLYGAALTPASATFSVGSVITPQQVAVDTAAQTNQNEFAFQKAIRTRQIAHLNAMLPIHEKFDPNLPDSGLTLPEVQSYLVDVKAFADEAKLLGGHVQTGTLISNLTNAVSTGISALYGSLFAPYNGPPVDLPPLSAAQIAARDAAFAAGQPYTQTWTTRDGLSTGNAPGTVAAPATRSYTFYPPGNGQEPLGARAFGLLTAADGTQERFAFDPTKGIDRLMTPNTFYRLDAFDPKTGSGGTVVFTTAASGTDTVVPDLPFLKDGSPVLADGLTAFQANIIGVDPTIASNLVPGLTDLAALQQGLFNTVQLPTAAGIQAALALDGEARAIALAGTAGAAGSGRTLALLATGTAGMAVVDITQPLKPALLAQLALTGTASDIAVDSQRQMAAVADGAGGLALVSYADPGDPAVFAVVPGQYDHVVAFAGTAYASTGGTVQAFDIVTGDLLAELAGAPGAITGLAIDHGVLYTMDSSHTLRAASLANGGLSLLSSLALPGGGNGLVVGNGIATIPAGDGAGNGGYLTVNVFDPANPALISGADNLGNAGDAVALNGSGLGLFAGQIQVFAQGLLPELDVVNTNDPGDTGARTQRFQLPAAAGGVAISGGLGFIADGTAGLQVVRYQAFTPNAVAPTVTITAPPTDLDPATPGTQVVEGSSIGLDVAIASPGQILSVDVLLNGHAVLTDLQYPFDLGVALPTIAQNGSADVSLEVRATDTNGNVTTSAPIVLDLVSDTAPPVLLSASVVDGGVISTAAHTLRFIFNKPLDPASATAANFALTTQGGATITPISVTLAAGGRTVQLVYPDLAVGSYNFTLNAPGVLSAAGIPLGATPSVIGFDAQPFTVNWVPATGGNWNTAANWDTGTVPTATDGVFIGTRLPVTITAASEVGLVVDRAGEIDQTAGGLTIGTSGDLANGTLKVLGGGFVANGPVSVGSLTLSGGSMSGTGTVTVNNRLTFTGGAIAAGLRAIIGPNAAASISGSANLASALDVAGTATISGAIALGSATAGVISVFGGGTLQVAGTLGRNAGMGGGVVNLGTILAAGGTLSGISVANTGGTILATDGTQLNLQSATITGGTLATLGTGAIRANDRTSLLQSVTIVAGATVTVTNNNYLALAGTIANAGTIALASVGNDTELRASGTVTLAGPGRIALSDTGANSITANGAPAILINAQTIAGAGGIGAGDANLAFTNAGTISATANNALTLRLPTPMANTGLIEGTGPGALAIVATTVNNTGGRIHAGATGHVDLQSATIAGGTLDTDAGGVIRATDRGSLLQSLTIAAGGNVTVTNNNYLGIAGAIANQGTITLASVGNDTALRASGTATLSGAGQVAFSGSPANRLGSDGATAVLVNQQRITGAGNIGSSDPLFTFRNEGTVDASAASALTIASPNTVTNTGTLMATGAAGLLISATTVNNAGGLVLAADASKVDLQSAAITGGTLTTQGTGLIRSTDRTPLLNGVAITAGSTVQVTNNNILALAGTIDNAGTILLSSVGNFTAVQASGTTTLQGSGALVFSDNGANRVTANGAAATLDLLQPLQGAGQVGDADPLLTIRNFSTISATGGNDLRLTSPNTIVNNGVIEGIGSGALRIESATVDGHGGGVIRAVGAGAHVDLVSATIDGGALLASGGGVIQAIDRGSVLRGTGLVAGSSLVVTNNQILTLQDELSTGATITLASVGNFTALQIDGDVTLQAGGLVQFTDNAANRITGATGSTLVNAGLIQGAGVLGDGAATLVVTNAAGGIIDANAGNQFLISFAGGTLTNAGLIQATHIGANNGLRIAATTIAGPGRLLAAGPDAHIDLATATITGGTLETTGGGRIATADRGSLIRDLTIAAGATLTNTNNNYLTIAGTIANAGTLALASVGNDTALLVSATATLSGTGVVALSDNGANRIGSDGADATLDLFQPLAGAGQIGAADAHFTFHNHSTVTASGGNRLTVNTPNLVTNQGTMQATGTGGLLIQSTAVDSTGGVIQAVGAGAHVDLQSATLTGGGLFAAGGGIIQVIDRGSVLHGAALAAGSALTILNNNQLTLADGLSTGSTISLASVGNFTALAITGSATLAPGASVLMGNNGANRILGGAGTALLNLGTIAGSGLIGDGAATLQVTNGAGGTIDATQSTALAITLAGGTLANAGLIRASAGAPLLILNSAIAQSGGTLLATGAAAHIDLQSAAITGGTLATDTGGVFNVVDRGSSLTNAAIAAGSAITITNNQFLRLAGAIANDGTITMASVGNDTAITVTGTTTLSGAGTLTSSDNGANRIISDGAPATLVNGLTITGALRIGTGDAGFAFVNNGTVTATASNGIVVDAPAGATNNGTMDAAAGSLTVSRAMLNAGLVIASGAPVFLAGAVTGTGNELLAGSAQLEFGASVAAGQTVTFAAGSTATLRLDAASSFAATIAGLAFDASNAVDLVSLGFTGASTNASFTGDTSGGTIHVTNGTTTVNLAVTGNYATAGFATVNDGANHVLLTVTHA